jgi:NAD(P)-dependent dehydrogenase (short-subunit alcohol dehydrogenase family)
MDRKRSPWIRYSRAACDPLTNKAETISENALAPSNRTPHHPLCNNLLCESRHCTRVSPLCPKFLREDVSEQSVFKRVGQVSDVADIVAFIASEDARWITGSFIDATGGTLLGSTL